MYGRGRGKADDSEAGGRWGINISPSPVKVGVLVPTSSLSYISYYLLLICSAVVQLPLSGMKNLQV